MHVHIEAGGRADGRAGGRACVIVLAGQLLGDIDAKKLTALASAQILAIESRGIARTLATPPAATRGRPLAALDHRSRGPHFTRCVVLYVRFAVLF